MRQKASKGDFQHSKNNVLKRIVALAATSLSLGRAEGEESELLGLRYRNVTDHHILSKVSFAGGLEFFIDGAGYDDLPHLNSVIFNPTQGEAAILKGPALNIDDEIQSATALGRLAYTTPPIKDIIGAPDYSAFSSHYIANNDENIEFWASVDNTVEATTVACPEGHENDCLIKYSLRYTPLLYDVSPSNVFLDQQLSLLINPMSAQDADNSDMDPVQFVKLSGTRTDSEGLIDYETGLSQYAVSSLKTLAGDQKPGNQIPEVRFRVGNAYVRESAKHCNFAGDDCWFVRTHPKIDSISKTDGYVTGGQAMTINGWGLKGDTLNDVTVTVDGVPCTVTTSTSEQITCVTGSAFSTSLDGVSQPGSPGLIQTLINSDNSDANPYWNMRVDGKVPVKDTQLKTAFEGAYNNYTRAGISNKGWFKAPATGNFKFYMSCDDACQLFFDETNKFDKENYSSPSVSQIAIRHSLSSWRDYIMVPSEESISQYQSEWIPMEAGEFYKIEGFQMEYGTNDHFTVSVEFEQEDTTGHHHANKEVQILSIDPANVAEKFNITVLNPVGGKFTIKFINPLYDPTNKRSVQIWTSDTITDNGSIWHVRSKIVRYFSSIFGTNISVLRTLYDANDAETTSNNEMVKIVYTVEMLRQINGPTFQQAQVIKAAGVSSTISIAAPYQQSTPPMSGNFFIACPNDDGTEFITRDMHYTHWAEGIDFYLHLEIPHLQFKAYVRPVPDLYPYRQNGIALMLIFQDYHGDVPQCEIRSSESTPITGNDVIEFNSITYREYGKNLMFEPVPLEFLYTDASQPQVIISVNGIDGVCPEFNCDFLYIEPTGQVTAQSLSNGVDLTITGTNLPTENIRVLLANAECETVTASETEITCTLNHHPAAGSWDVQVIDSRGMIPLEVTLDCIDVALVIDSISPSVDLNQLGGDILTFTGTGFDSDTLDTAIVFSDETTCIIQSAIATELKCLVDGFDVAQLDIVNAYDMSITVNDVVNTDQTLMLKSTKQSGQTVSPNSVSPVLATVLTVTLESTYPETLVSADDFSAILISKDDPSITRKLFVMSVDDSTKSLQIKFPGADSGFYYLNLVGAGVGRIDPTPLELEVTGRVDGISPITGSSLGGTLVTIDGINFSDDPLDNPVMVGPYWCYVQSTNASQIKCRVGETGTTEISSVQVMTFLRTSEEAVQGEGVSIAFEYADPIASVTGFSNEFIDGDNTQCISLVGTGFGTETDAVELYIDGVLQTVESCTDTEVTFTLTGMLDETSANVQIYFPDGFPSGYAEFVSSITVTPTLVSVSPSTGSSGGTLLTVTGNGFGTSTEGINLIHESSGSEMCEEVSITGYGTFTCLTKAMEITAGDTILLATSSGEYACGNTLNPDECNFEQLAASSPAVTEASISSSSTISITGTDFPTTDYDVIVVYQGVESDSAVINDSTSITASFDQGIPVGGAAASPSIRFVPASNGRRLVSLSDAGEQLVAIIDLQLTNELAVTDSTSGLSCSFQGGCPYTITAAGLTATFIGDETNSINVCGNPCTIDTDASDADQMTCNLPYVSTAYSADTFEIVTEGILHDGTWTGTASDEELAKLIDGKNMVDMNDSTSSDCYFQIQYKENHVGVLDEVKFFINRLQNKTPFVDNLVFQGSDDGSTFVDLWAIDKSVHEGWNSLDFEEEGERPSYNIYRFQGTKSGSCRIGEVKLHGVESIDDDQTSHVCTPKLTIGDSVTELNTVTFDENLTPVLTGMSTRFGSVLGGETVEFYGTRFSDTAATTILIDDRECVIATQTTTQITCTTSDKPYRPDTPRLTIYIDGLGYVATAGQIFRYVSLWSESQTWGYDLPPQEGEAVNIPKGLHLLVDVDSTPILSFINVEGSLIFPPDSDPNHQRSLDAHYILVKGGYMEVGTEENRYTSKLTITMHSTVFDPNLPIFGNKVIGVNYGVLEMHGTERPVTWTDLKETVQIGGTEITLNDVTGDPLDWAVGEEIVIASTDFSGRNAEQRTITAITNTDTNPVITFDEPLLYKHYAGVQYFGDDFIEMRAEVGLLSRNVKYQGDDSSPENQYGAVIIMHSPGDETTAARIDGIELFNVGQAFILGSYPIHFHMIGTVHSSYVRNNAIHHTFNRAVTIHGVHYLRVENNVAYHTMGHTIFIEDAAETKNFIDHNLIVDVRRSWSLLNTDQTPASIWITNPNNIITNNHAAGSDRYSYWYDLQVTAIGPSFDTNICPENTRLGEFRDNVAHSNGRYGLRIFHNLIPREHPCEAFTYSGDPDDPYPTNAPIIANFHNLVSYKNKRNGAIAERVGAVQWHNFKTADNLQAGMEYSITSNIIDGYAKIVGGLVIGRSENTEEALDWASPKGIINSRTEGFTLEGVKFYNFNYNRAAAMGTCSHCWHDNNTDSGGRTITVSDLYFDETVTQRILYTTPWRTIFFDKTGGLTGLGPNTWFVPYWNHLLQPECEAKTEWGGIVCDSSVEIRRIALHGMPSNFFGMRLKITQLERADEKQMLKDGTYQEYIDSESNYSLVPFKDKQDPTSAWAMPYVTNHRYRLHWEAGLDFEAMKVELSEKWLETDQNVFLVFNHTESREAVNITTGYGSGEQIPKDTLLVKSASDLVTGDNWIRNETDPREFEFVVNGKNQDNMKILIEPLECISGVCALEEIVEVELEEGQRLWSDPKSWVSGSIPVDGDDVEVMSGWNMLLDIAETPKLNSLSINGRLQFIQREETPDIHVFTNNIFVRAGELIIGSEEEPFEGLATITLTGDTESDTLNLGGTVEGGNKILAITNQAQIYGKPRVTMSRLLVSVYRGQDQIIVGPEVDWEAGDQIYLAPTNMQMGHSEYRTIESIQGGVIILDESLSYYHYGDGSSTGDDFNGVDMRGEVILLTRNVKIEGERIDRWGGQILVTDIFEFDGTWRKGSLYMDNVWVDNCSQKDAYHSAIRFEGATGGHSYISNSAITHGLDWGVMLWSTSNVELHNNAFVDFRAIGMNLDQTRNCTIVGNFIGDVYGRDIQFIDMTIDKEACVAYGSYVTNDKGSPSHQMTFMNNIAAGCPYAGFVAPGHACGDTDSRAFYGNIAHSVGGYGSYVYQNPAESTGSCFEVSNIIAYKVSEPCVMTWAMTKEHRAHSITCIDNEKGVSLNTSSQELDEVEINFFDSHIYGGTKALDCPQGSGDECYCKNKYGFMTASNMNDQKGLMPTMASALPIYTSHGEGNWGGRINMDNVRFTGFQGKTDCGMRNVIFERNPMGSDKIPPHFFDNCKFEDVTDDGFAFLDKPDPAWANIKDCGNFPCTAPNNVIFTFTNTKYYGATPSIASSAFTLVPDDETVGGAYTPACTHKPDMQVYICQVRNIGLLQLENLDIDAWDRAIQPIQILNEEKGFNNTVNAMMDHIWDTFYTGQRRMARFPIAIQTENDYTVRFAGTPPKKIRFNLDASVGGVKILIPYPVAGSIQVTANGKKKSYTPWDDALGRHGPLTKTKGCGENRFVGIENFLEFYISPGCEILLEPKDSIMTKVRMDWSLAEFYSDGGTTRFVDRLAASLGIAANRIKTVAVYEGSVVVDFIIESEDGQSAEDAAATLQQIKVQLVEQVEAGIIDMGAPVMGIQQEDGEVLSGDPIPDAPGAGSTFGGGTTVVYDGDGNSAIVGDSNLWDDLIKPDPVPEPTPVVEEPTPTPTPEPTPEPTLEPVVEEPTPEPQPVIEEPTPEPEPVVEEPTPEPEPVVEEPTSEPEPVVEEAVVPEEPAQPVSPGKTIAELFPQDEEPVEPEIQPEQQPETLQPAEQPRETIIVTKIVEVFEEDQQEITAEPEVKKDNKSQGLMVIVSAAIVGLLVLIAIVMAIRYCNKRKAIGLHPAQMADVKTQVIQIEEDIEPQFVMEADDGKNIFGRPSTAALQMDIEKSEAQGKNGRKVRKGKKSRGSRPGSRGSRPGTQGSQASSSNGFLGTLDRESVPKSKDDSIDDGFNYHGQNGPCSPKSMNSSQKSFMTPSIAESTRKLKSITLRKIEDQE